MTVVGVDQSLTSTGIVVLDGKNEPAVAECLKYKGQLASGGAVNRLAWIRDTVCARVHAARGAGLPTPLIAMEGYGFAARQSHSHSLGELGGVLRVALFEMGLPLVIVPPTTLKKFTTGQGNAPKGAMLKAVFQRWAFDTNNDNIADAYALARFAHTLRTGTTKTDRALIDKVEFLLPAGVDWK